MDDKLKEYKRRYYEKNKQKILAKQKEKKLVPQEEPTKFWIEKKNVVLEW